MTRSREGARGFEDELDAAKRETSLELLFRCARLVNEAAIERVRAASKEELRAAHTALFPHVSLEGTRLTELAARLGVSKQAVGQLVDELEAMGVLERVPDPTDGRARLVRWSAKGRRAMLHGLSVLRDLERELEASIGARRMDELRRALRALEPAIPRAR